MFPVLQKWVSLYFAPVPRPEVQAYMATFEYSRLPPNTRSFRVFHLFPRRPEDQTSGDDLSGILRGRVEVMNIDEDCRYNALSYCWEGSIDPSPYTRQRKDRILIEELDGRISQLLISPALSTALRYLRSRGQSLPLFVDQICINQQDEGDKNQQIDLMGDIYRNCVCVVAWLDVATKYTDALFDFLPRISRNELLLQLIQQPQRQSHILEAAMEKRTNFSGSEMLEQDVKVMVELTREHWGRFPHRGFLDICLRRWFRRIWIIQEACLGPKMMFVCGRRSCSANALEIASKFRLLGPRCQELEGGSPLEHHQAKWDKEAMHNAFMGTTVVFRIFQERAAALGPPLEEQSVAMSRGLASLVTKFNVDTMVHGPWVRLGFSNPRDTIYALRGLVSDGDPVSERLVTNYMLPPATIFTDFTRLLFDASTGHPAIDTLLLSQMDTKRIDGLPSWVPDWSANVVIPYGYHSGCIPMFNAGGGNREPYVCPEVDVSSPNILSVKGILLCKIDRVGEHFMEPSSRRPAHPMETPTLLPQSIFHFFREVRELCEWASKQPNSASIPSIAKLDEAVWVTTTGGHGFTKTTEQSLLGTRIVDGKPLLGFLWDFQLQMDLLPTAIKRRRDGLASISTTWAANKRGDPTNRFPLLSTLYASFIYWSSRLLVEVLHLYRLYRIFIMQPYIFLFKESEDMLYYSIFGAQKTDIGFLKYVLGRHTRRKCFVSRAGHVGLGPVDTHLGDVVVVPLGATLPVVLRPGTTVNDPWTYVGEAYCHGFMDGEALVDANKPDKRWFKIK
ncbi:hypothetical protein IFR05_004787 [Cadophora sp. M221]|nr:hypothetical protein IFR05_004787 [Cadophora sp. M221]